ncbi:MAG: sigma 54-interacting transcriptional regulator [Bacteroidota bacterium]
MKIAPLKLRKILIVEDDLIIAEDIKVILEKSGITITGICKSAEQALLALEQETPDLIILDIILKGKITGIMLAQHLNTRKIPFIYLTAHSNKSTMAEAIATEPYGYLVKPFLAKDLMPTLQLAFYKFKSTALEQKLLKEVHEKENALAQLKIQYMEDERTLLYSITAAISKVRDLPELIKTVFNTIEPVFGCNVCEFLLLNATGKSYTAAVFPSFGPITIEDALSGDNHFREGSYIKKWMHQMDQSDELLTLEYHQEMAPYPPTVTFFQRMKDAGYQESCLALLKVGTEVLGIFFIHFNQKSDLDAKQKGILQLITEQVSVALANILANEEIKRKVKEIEILNKQLKAQNAYLLEEVEQAYNFDEMIGQNQMFLDACKNIGMVANTDSTVLILGETGTGKELVARAIHNNSPRKNKPLIKLNCASLPASLIESELFGHERGAFTGAIERRIGKFELAHGSTLFLDEIGELPLELQAKLLRALQEKEIERLGSNKTIQIDVRIIAATNRDLNKEVQAGRFRQDLYYRLYIFPITLPPLRARKEDIPLLTSHFIQKYNKKIGKNIQGLSHKAMQEMMNYNWPGNIRELEHVMERSVIINHSKLIQHLDLPDTSKKRIIAEPAEFLIKTWEQQERDYILEILKITKGKVTGTGGAAELLQLPPTTLQSKMLKLGIKRKHYVETDKMP